ncbi:gas vesicle protein GvpO [Marinococcus sp. PL1-022]|uniref:gas vesicle protein GvpO n=1 Tax=Marinococcus sp. PL1-022 TaxID=3095363 RepID=UPI0029C29809|nr:gas vesicle protein GvpO [Marinococcus sp. PL1-022]MDX6151513.1 gas vesicle protein GvpO [Marinococcus sp. PL1-022]
MAAKQSTAKTEEKTDESQGQELKTSKSGSYKPFSSEEGEEEQPKEQIKGPAKSDSSSEASQKSSGQNEKTDDKGENEEVNNTTATASKKNTAKSNQTKKEANEETAQQEESFAPISSDMFETIRSFFEETMNSPVRITAIVDAGNGWNIEVELVEEKEYTQKYGRDQLIGIYEATMNKDQKITSYQRMNTRPRSTPFEKKER